METKPGKRDSNRLFSVWKVLWALVLVHLFLGTYVLLVPNGQLDLGFITLKSTPLKDIFQYKEIKKVSIDSVIGSLNPIDESVVQIDPKEIEREEAELLQKEIKQPISFPPKIGTAAMKAFFMALLECERSGTLMRILHYGDSQLEGDRISDYLRNRMQLRFGGYGPGLLLLLEPTAALRPNVHLTQSGDWVKKAIYGNLNRSEKGIYGPGATAYQFTGTYNQKIGEDTLIRKVFPVRDTIWRVSNDYDSLSPEMSEQPQYDIFIDSGSFYYDTLYQGIYQKASVNKSWIRARFNKYGGYPRSKTYSTAGLLYHSDEPFGFQLNAGNKKEFVGVKGANANVVSIPIDSVSSSVEWVFADQNPLIFGVLLDGDSGVAVDNIPMRGSSGTGFEMIDANILAQFYSFLNVKLIIFQYGINVVPNVRTSYAYYEVLLGRQLAAVKRAAPNASVLVIGPSDMSRNGIESYPNIPLMRDAMRAAAFQNGCAFWDLYEAMGGKNSMQSWVQSNPPLGNKDFTHFSPAGARYVGEMMYHAIMQGYLSYKKELAPKQKSASLP